MNETTAQVGQGPGWHRAPTGLLRVAGSDRVALLHRLSTQDLRGLQTVGAVADTLFATAQGRVVAWARIYAMTDTLWLCCDVGCAAALAAWIEKYTIMEDVTVQDCSAGWCEVKIFGAAGATSLHLAAAPPARTWAPVPALCAPAVTGGCELTPVVTPLMPAWGQALVLLLPLSGCVRLAEVLATHAVPNLDDQALEIRRLLGGIPSVLYELQGGANPLEMRLGPSTIDWHKGCYIGQEVLSRLESYGKVARLLMGFTADAMPSPAATGPYKLMCGSRSVGRVTSWAPHAAGMVGLALVKREVAATPGVQAELTPGSLPVRLVDRPFWQKAATPPQCK